MKITKLMLMKRLSKNCNIRQEMAMECINEIFSIMFQELSQGNKVTVPYIGILVNRIHQRKRRGTINGQTSYSPERLVIKLISSKMLDDNMKKLLCYDQMERTELFK